jgi:Zn-dependent protease with chaperone function
VQPALPERALDPSPPTLVDRRRLLKAGAAGIALALPGAAALAQREGVQVGPPSRFESLVPAAAIEAEAARGYADMLAQARAAHRLAPPDHVQVRRLVLISSRLRPFAGLWNERAVGWNWEVNLIGSPQVNAFCMPGGKIAFYWGILSRLRLSDDEVAMVMGHEMTHALREHGRSQIGKQVATQGTIALLAGLFGWGNAGRQAAGMGGRLLSLKYSRDDETEADLIGLELAARAGYMPQAAISLWQKMQAASKGAPPGFLSDHPSNPDRLRVIAANIPRVQGLYDRAPKPGTRFGPPLAG